MILKEERLHSINKPRPLAIQVAPQEVQRPQSIARCQVRHCRSSFEASLSLTASVTFDPCPLTSLLSSTEASGSPEKLKSKVLEVSWSTQSGRCGQTAPNDVTHDVTDGGEGLHAVVTPPISVEQTSLTWPHFFSYSYYLVSYHFEMNPANLNQSWTQSGINPMIIQSSLSMKYSV